MNNLIHLVPVAGAMVGWYAVYRVNRRYRWLRIGEVIFWDIVLLIILFLAWLIWF